MKKLNNLIVQLESNVSHQQIANQSISKSNIGWHIKHALLTIDGIIEALKKSNPSKYKWNFKILRLIVFTLKKIPRGRGKSPKIVIPQKYDELSLIKDCQNALVKIKELELIDKDKYFKHPYFGNLKLDKAIKFLEMHTNHHLKIINDILNVKIEEGATP